MTNDTPQPSERAQQLVEAINAKSDALNRADTAERALAECREALQAARERLEECDGDGRAWRILNRALAATAANGDGEVPSAPEKSSIAAAHADPSLHAAAPQPDYRAEAMAWRLMVDTKGCKVVGEASLAWMDAASIRDANEAAERGEKP